MNKEVGLNFKLEVEEIFKEAILNFKLRVFLVDESEVLLAGERFALSFSYDREGVDIGYVESAIDGGFLFHRITNFIGMSRFSSEDRLCYGCPEDTVEGRVRASLRVVYSGLTKRCVDILSGDRAWINALREKDREAYKGLLVSARVAACLSSIWCEVMGNESGNSTGDQAPLGER